MPVKTKTISRPEISANLNLSNSAIKDDLSDFNKKNVALDVKAPQKLKTTAKRKPATASAQPPPPKKHEKVLLAENIGIIINKSRLLRDLPEYKENDPLFRRKIAAWFEIFTDAAIPADAVNECYKAALETYRRRHAAGEFVPDKLDANFIAAQWITIAAAYYDRRTKGKIGTVRHYDCPDCLGNETGYELNFTPDGKTQGYKFGTYCRHLNKEDE